MVKIYNFTIESIIAPISGIRERRAGADETLTRLPGEPAVRIQWAILRHPSRHMSHRAPRAFARAPAGRGERSGAAPASQLWRTTY
ncbi:hypothetical protein RR48_07641 [Papilio machaon]|uniref:Uncharacterized protein n=1 Tax=Papilio machaon TaxID=76193 RepID=A0A194QQH9_PAPMA|nr:hypothetical protein RR48_07641 [Papilio machaon]